MLVREGRGEHIHVTQRVMELCLGTTDSLEIPLSRIFPPQTPALEGAAVLLPLPSKGWGMQGMRKAGSKELYQHPAARQQLAPLKRCARKSGSHWCQTALKRSQGRRHPQTVFPHGIFHNPMQTSKTQPWLSGASTSGGTHPSLCPKTDWSA